MILDGAITALTRSYLRAHDVFACVSYLETESNGDFSVFLPSLTERGGGPSAALGMEHVHLPKLQLPKVAPLPRLQATVQLAKFSNLRTILNRWTVQAPFSVDDTCVRGSLSFDAPVPIYEREWVSRLNPHFSLDVLSRSQFIGVEESAVDDLQTILVLNNIIQHVWDTALEKEDPEHQEELGKQAFLYVAENCLTWDTELVERVATFCTLKNDLEYFERKLLR